EGGQQVSAGCAIPKILMAGDRAALQRLRGHFTATTEVFLEVCQVGVGSDGEALLMMLSEMWNVKVTAGVSFQRPLPGHEGTEVIARPDGHGGARISMRESA